MDKSYFLYLRSDTSDAQKCHFNQAKAPLQPGRSATIVEIIATIGKDDNGKQFVGDELKKI